MIPARTAGGLIGHGVGAFVLTAWPALAGYAAWLLASGLWGELILALPRGSRTYAAAWAAWPAASLLGPALVMWGAVVLAGHDRMRRGAAVAAILGLVVTALITAGPEVMRLAAYRPMPLADVLGLADRNIALALAFALIVAAAGAAALSRTRPALRGRVTRARTDSFGHADWMSMTEARRLFASRSRQGGVVIGEAYRVDRDTVAGRAFEPGHKRTWGRGGTAPLLISDLSRGSSHGLVFAGSGGFKTVSTCVPTLLHYRGPVVTLDPSVELAPMLTAARREMGHRVVAIDPDNPAETGFNALDWLDTSKAGIDGDIRAVVDWICGERPPVTAAHGQVTGHAFFEGSGKALVEALLSDLVFAAADLDPDRCTLAVLAERLALPEREMREELERIHDESRSPRAAHLAGQLMGLVAETFSGVYGNMSQQTEWLATPKYAALVSGSAFKTRELVEGTLDVFVTIPLKTLQATPALARVIVGALLNAVYEADGALTGGRVVFLLDEAARLGAMSALARARDAGRKYGITLILLFQSEGQLKELWGEGGRTAWFESASWRSYAAVASLEQAKGLSEAAGEHGIEVTSESANTGRSRKLLSLGTRTAGSSRQTSERGRRLVTPSELLAEARADEQIVFVTGRKPLRCGRAIYFRRPEMVARVGENRFAPKETKAHA